MNIYNRCFDDQRQVRIRLETASIEGIFELAESGRVELAWSFMLDYENSLNPYEDRKEWASLLSRLCRRNIAPVPRILSFASILVTNPRLKPRDALHLSCAEIGECDYFVTCDDALIRACRGRQRRPKLKVKAINPIDFIRREIERHG